MEGLNTLRYYLYDEICIHNKKDDFWVVIHDHVLDLTTMLKDRLDSWNSVGSSSINLHQYYLLFPINQ